MPVASSRLRSAADELLRKISTFSESRTPRTKRSHPETTRISSRHQVTVPLRREAG
jgi:hypothetical protein